MLVPEDPGLVPEDPGSEPEDPGTEPEDPGAEPEDPGAEPEDPGAEPEPTDRVRRPVKRPADRTARPACALAAGPCFSAVSAAASAAMLACWAAALACRPIQRLAVSVVDNLSVADRVVASAPVLGWGFSADAAPSTDGDAAVGADGADRAPAWAPPWAAARADPLGARTVTTVLVRVASRNSPMAANSMMMMPETSGLIWGRMGARARTTAATHTA